MKKYIKVLAVLAFMVATCMIAGRCSSTSGSFTPPTRTPWTAPTSTRPSFRTTPVPHTPVPYKTPTTKTYETKTKVFAGQTPGEALAEWKEAFPEWTVVEWKIRVDGNELEISYTK